MVTTSELKTHMKLHEGYARRWNEGLGRGQGTVSAIHDWGGCQLHNLFWSGLEPETKGDPWALAKAAGYSGRHLDIGQQLYHRAVEIQGSGWSCVSGFPAAGELIVHAVPNHEYPWDDLIPLVVVDVWEHAFLSRLTDRPSYVQDLLRLVNWNVAVARLSP